jgi:EpsI family protein
MTADKLGTWALAVVALAVGGLVWWLQTRSALAVDPSPLASLPLTVGSWQSRDVPLESAVESILRADFNVQRVYFHTSAAAPIWLYLGYYGTDRGGRPEHVPRGCYTGAGWDIESARVVDAGDGTGWRTNEYRVAKGGERQLVHFWYRSSRRTGMMGGIDQRLDQILGRVESGRADGALIRISTTLPSEGESEARAELFAFGRELDHQLAEHWPIERAR